MCPESRAGVVCAAGWAESWPDPVQICNGGPGVTGSGAAGSGGARRRRGRVGRHRPGTRERLPGIRTHRTGFRGRWRLEGYRGPAGLDGRGIHRLRCARVRSTGLRQSTGCCGIGIVMMSSRVMGRHRPAVSASTSCCAEVPGFGTTESPQPGGNDSQALARQRPRLSGPASGNSQVETWWWANRSGFRFRTLGPGHDQAGRGAVR